MRVSPRLVLMIHYYSDHAAGSNFLAENPKTSPHRVIHRRKSFEVLSPRRFNHQPLPRR
jgi:hypothetical protein